MAASYLNDINNVTAHKFVNGLSDYTAEMVNTAPPHVVDAEFIELRRKALDGCQRSMQYIFHSNSPLVAKLVTKSFRFNPDVTVTADDRFQMGMMGIQRALIKFDAERGFRFSTYATPWITQFIIRGVTEQTGSYGVYLPNHFHSKLSRIRRFIREYERRGEKFMALSDQEIVDIYMEQLDDNGHYKAGVELTVDNLKYVRQYIDGACMSADTMAMNEEGEDISMWELVESDDIYRFEDISRIQDAETILPLLDALNEQELMVIAARFYEERTLEDVGQELGRTRERVRQIEAMALKKMKARHNSNTHLPVVPVGMKGRDMKDPTKKRYPRKELYGLIQEHRAEGLSRKEIMKLLNININQFLYADNYQRDLDKKAAKKVQSVEQ